MLILARFMIATMIIIVLTYWSIVIMHVFYAQTIVIVVVVVDIVIRVSSTPQSTSLPVTNYPQAIVFSTHILYTSYYYSSLSTIFSNVILMSITLFPSHLYSFSISNLEVFVINSSSIYSSSISMF